jgi:hypothetical protein
MMRLGAIAALALVAGCTAPPPRPAAIPAPPVPLSPPLSGLDRVMGRNASQLQALFGEIGLDIREGPARKLQFASPVCVLDAYLYAPKPGAEPVVSYIDARLANGDDFDRASCIAALVRRREAR